MKGEIAVRYTFDRRATRYNLPLNLFIGDKRKVPLVDVVVWAKKRIFPKKPDGLQGYSENDGPSGLQCVG